MALKKFSATLLAGTLILLSPGLGCYQAAAEAAREIKLDSSEMALGDANEETVVGPTAGKSQGEDFLDAAAFQGDAVSNFSASGAETIGREDSADVVMDAAVLADVSQDSPWLDRVKTNIANIPNHVRAAHGSAAEWVRNAMALYRQGLPLVLNFDGLSPHGSQLNYAVAGYGRLKDNGWSLSKGNGGSSRKTPSDSPKTQAGAKSVPAANKPAPQLALDPDTLKLYDKIDTLLDLTQKLQHFNGDFERRNAAQLRKRMYLLSFSMSLNEPYKIIDMYLLLFRRMEQAYLIIKDGDAKIAGINDALKTGQLPTTTAAAQIARVKGDSRRLEAIDFFGVNYHEFFLVRSYLEQARDHNRLAHTYDVIGHDSTAPLSAVTAGEQNATVPQRYSPASTARLILSRLDIPLKGTGDKNSFDLANFKQLFGRHPEMRYAGLKSDLAQEIWATVKYFTLAQPFLDAVKNLVYRLPPAVRTPVSAVLGIAYDEHIRDKFLPDIARVSHTPMTGDASMPFPRLMLLRELNAKNGQDNLMLVTFARLVEERGVWADLKAQIKTARAAKGDNLIKKDSSYVQFLADMDAAEKEANKFGPLSLLYDQRPIDKAAKILYAAIVLAYYFHTHPDVVHRITSSIQGLIHSVGL